MKFKSTNPWNGEVISTWPEHSSFAIQSAFEYTREAFELWREVPIAERAEYLLRAAGILEGNIEEYSRTITLEMGKPIKESRAEIRKCAWVCRFYSENAEQFLADEMIETDAAESFISYDPLGAIFAVMPWNFPFWQVFRFAAPTLMAGNSALLKHASNVSGCAVHIEEIFRKAGFPENLFLNLRVHHDKVEDIIANEAVKAVTLTGSEATGRIVGSLAGKNLKKSVLELGGSNAFIVCEDADMDQTVETAVKARMSNSGQSCISSKRFILVGSAYDAFVSRFVDAVEALRTGDPLEEETQIGTLAREDLAEDLHEQVRGSVAKGAVVLTGGNRKKAFYEPTVLDGVKPGMPAFDEETFGPVAALIRAADEDEAFELAARSRYGLGVSLFSTDIERARINIPNVQDGAYFINDLVKSDPRLPFGGTKNSGYGRELSREGIREFVNKKTVYIKQPGQGADTGEPVE